MLPAGELLFALPRANNGVARKTHRKNEKKPTPIPDAGISQFFGDDGLSAAIVHGQSADRELAIPSKFAQVADR
jgi:hypothetical protein